MKKIKVLLLLALTLTLVLGLCVNANATFGRTYTACKGTPVLDGEIDDVWNTVEWTAVDKDYLLEGVVRTNAKLFMKILWDEDHLYFLAHVYDETANKRNDLVEVYLDQNHNKSTDYQADDTHTRFKVLEPGVISGVESGQNAQLEAPSACAKLDANNYILEGALDWPAGTPKAGDVMGLEFMYQDAGLYTPLDFAFRWNADTTGDDQWPYEGTSAFGDLTLAEAGTPDPAKAVLPGEDAPAATEPTVTEATDATTAPATTEANAEAPASNTNIILYIVGGVIVAIAAIIIIFAATQKKKKQ